METIKYMIAAGLIGACAVLGHGEQFLDWAKTPPMGWNSFDCFGTTITEDIAKKQADAQSELLKPFGWTMLTVDIQWYEDNSTGHGYKSGAPLTMDEFGRLQPEPRNSIFKRRQGL